MGSRPRTPLWLDCDTGHDDALAILLAARGSDVHLLGISTVYGNAPLSKTTYNTRAILKAIHREAVPVYAGADKPYKRQAVHAPSIHGESGLDGTTCLPVPTAPAREDVSAVEAMYRALKAEAKATAWVVATGALTNVAALFRQHTDLVEHIAGLSVMGGAIGGGFTNAPMGKIGNGEKRFGNWTPYAEFNIYCDPESAQEIFSNGTLAAKTTLVTIDLTHQFLATSEVQMGLLFGYNTGRFLEPTIASVSHVRRLFFEVLTFFAKAYADVFGLKAGPPIHDPLAVAAVLYPDLFSCNPQGAPDYGDQDERFHVDVVTEGGHGSTPEILNSPSQCGRTIATAVKSGEPGVRIPRSLDTRELWAILEGCLSRTEVAIQRQHSNEVRIMRPGPELKAFAGMTNPLYRGTFLSDFRAGQGMPDVAFNGMPMYRKFMRNGKEPGLTDAWQLARRGCS